jgi:hypothetical protein
MDITLLRASRNSDFSKIQEVSDAASNPESTKKSYEDTRFWKPERDKAGNATATIRFLARTQGDELPWVKIFTHGFKGPTGRWYIENSLTTIGKPDPLGEFNMRLWNSTTDDNSPERKQARDQKRKLSYISNVLVVNDPKHPENNGQVFLFKFGKKIYDKIMDKARPSFEDEQPVNVFDYWDGANFKLRMKMVDRYPNYDTSEFEGVAPVADSDEEILEIVNQQYKLAEFLQPNNFKSYDELKTKLESVLSGVEIMETASEVSFQEEVAVAPTPRSKPAPAPKVAKKPSEDDDDEMMSYFQSIAKSDD